jgi:AcrR family transcriptional regulator
LSNLGRNQKTYNRNSKKQQQILETAEDLFFRFGIKRVTVEEICQKANVSKMTFYKYFANKIDLLKHIAYAGLEKGYKKLNEVEAMPVPFPERLQTMLEYRLEHMAKMSTEFIDEIMQTEFYAPIQKAWFQRVMQFLADAQKRGDIRPEIRPEFILAMFHKMNELVDDKHLMSLYPNYVELSREIFNFLYYGILPRTDSENLV